MQIPCYQHFVMVVQPAFFICDVCLGFNVVFFANDTAEGFILERFPGNVGKVPGCGVVFRVVKAVGVDKMGIFAAQFLGSGIHHIYEVRDTPAHEFCHAGGDFIGRSQKDGVQTLFHCKYLTRFDADMCAAGFNAVYCFG